MHDISRPEFITLLASAAAWPLASLAQPAARARRLAALLPYDEADPEGKCRLSALMQAIADLGWTDGSNAQMDRRWWTGDDINQIRALARELVGPQPDIILAGSTPSTAALQRETQTIPIVF